jgi:exopolysaccharide production protein ExoZ
MRRAASRSQLVSIQLLRAAAALAVLLAHIRLDFVTRLDIPERFKSFEPGMAGVDLFFVISGFVMVHASAGLFGRLDGPAIFWKRRLARIVPLYWAVTTLYVALSLVVPSARSQYEPSLILASYLFWPYPREGEFFPVVGLGWTLNYEMFFYLLFGMALFLRRGFAVAAVGVALAALVLLGSRITLTGPLAFWSNSIVLEFVLGMLLALAFKAGLRLPLGLAAALAAAGVAGLYLAGAGWLAAWPRGLVWGLPAAAIFAGAVLGRWPPGRYGLAGAAVALGDASYALYLTHAFVIRFFRELAEHGVLDPKRSPYLYAALVTATACAAAIAVYRVFERPATRWLQARFAARRMGPALQADGPRS